MDALNSLLTTGYPWAVNRAQAALHIQNAVQSGQMSKSEALELLQDIIATDKLDKEANNFTIKTELVNAVTALISVVTSIPTI